MGPPLGRPQPTVSPCRPWRWNPGTLTALAVAVFVAVTAGQSPAPVVAQPARPGPAAHVYRQTQVAWTAMDNTLTAWEGKGWEAFQVVPIANPNPGSGGAMQVALVFRRPATGGK